MRIAVVGVGAMGCLLGAHLSQVSGVGVTLIGHWPDQIDRIRRHGLWMTRPDGSRSHHTPAITSDALTVAPVDVALVAVKSLQTAAAGQLLADLLRVGDLALTLQNGLNNRATLQKALGVERVALGVTSEGATMLDVGEVRHAGQGRTHIGRDPALGTSQQNRLNDLVWLLNRAGFDTTLVDNTDELVWGKLAVNAAINPLTALLRVPNGFLLQHTELIDIMRRTAAEVATVAERQGIPLPYADAGDQALMVASATAANHSSMLQDVLRGAPTEIEAICGAVGRAGRQFAVLTPLNDRLCRLVRRLENEPPLVERGDVAGLISLLSAA